MAQKQLGVLKYGVGYDLVVNRETGRLVLGLRCHQCQRVSYHPQDVEERYCSACKLFFHDRNPDDDPRPSPPLTHGA